jgi:hypothetical protein
MLAGEFYQEIEFFRAVLEQVARAFVALEHILPKLPVIIGSQGPFSCYDALNLGNNVPRAFIFPPG